MSVRRPFKIVEAERPEFTSAKFHYSRTLHPDWRPGNGLNGRLDLPGYQHFVDGASPEGSQTSFRHINPDEVEDKTSLYKLMIGSIVPRPIAFVSSISASGEYNLAPFSYFTPLGHRPPMIMLHFGTITEHVDGQGGQNRDTLDNIKATGEFVINIISEPFVEAANFTAVNAPPEINEWDLAGLTPVPSDVVNPPRVGESPFCMECTLEASHDIYSDPEKRRMTATYVIGRIKRFHARKDLFGPTDAIEPCRLLPVSRLGGITYGRTTDCFEIPMFTWDQVKDDEDVKRICQDVKETGGKLAAYQKLLKNRKAQQNGNGHVDA